MDMDNLVAHIKKLSEPSVLVVGDLALDEMIYGDAERISREAPVLILQHTHTKLIPGGASNAAYNAAMLNKNKVSVIGVVGDDFQASQLKKALGGVNVKYLVSDKIRKTTTKTRVSGAISTSITQQIVRIDRQTNAPLSAQTEKKVIANLEKAVPLHDAIILSDYHIGTLTPKIIKKTIELANKHKKVIVVDAQRDLQNYKNITAMTPNLPDTQKSVGFEIKTETDLKKAGGKLLRDTKAKSILITRGADGMYVVQKNKQTKIPVFNKSEVFDVTGAGDTVTAVYTLALASGADAPMAALISNIAASIVVKHFGCATTTIEELIELCDKRRNRCKK
jgi:rfaE bifunctional protein kinase chain/domain